MSHSRNPDTPVANGLGDAGVSDPEPAPIKAQPEPMPYHASAAVVGKVFFDTPEGSNVCSGTAVRDPARPGQSNLVWTAGHCVHAGARGGWYRNIVFVPSYNNDGLSGRARQYASLDRIAPFGTWWADWAQTSSEWISEGAATGGAGAPFDFAVLHVRPPTGLASLEEAIGQAAPVRFGVPTRTAVSATSAWGYPAAPPFDGEHMFSCLNRPGRLSIRADQPTMYRIGCTMTGGSSGGGWFARDADGSLALISNTSIGSVSATWLAGPQLGSVAKDVYGAVSAKFAHAPGTT
ncbi:trypsin-like serine peptidase [Streptomyces sp. NPDC058086]|uniref:trypsin-like serine peptidase n=1 Tax=Streptomyces sp. NPDC058086 TaxID=3346334 RepID=UPI0036E66979